MRLREHSESRLSTSGWLTDSDLDNAMTLLLRDPQKPLPSVD